MAIFHLNVSIIKKAGTHKQHSIVSAAAYRHRCTMSSIKNDLNIDQTFNYKRKNSDLVDEFLMFPDTQNKFLNSLKNEPVAVQSELIWQQVELQEKRKDAQFAREVELSLHHDLTLEQNKALLQQFINKNFTSVGMIADVAIHNPGNNLHAHILLSMREIDTNSHLKIFGQKNRDWNNLELVNVWRESWENLSNEHLKLANVNAQISSKTLLKQKEMALAKGDYIEAAKCDRKPTSHIYRGKFSLPGFDDQEIKFDFEEALEQRKQLRLKEIQNNVTKYVKNRAIAYTAVLAKIRNRANATISNVANIARKQQQRLLVSIFERSNKQSNANAGITETTGTGNTAKQEQLQQNNEITKSNSYQSLLNEVDKEIEMQKKWKHPYLINPKLKPS